MLIDPPPEVNCVSYTFMLTGIACRLRSCSEEHVPSWTEHSEILENKRDSSIQYLQ